MWQNVSLCIICSKWLFMEIREKKWDESVLVLVVAPISEVSVKGESE